MNTPTVYIVDLEAIETRYTGEWKIHLPKQMKQAGFNVEVVEGPSDLPNNTTPGMFLNFSATNIYKSVQAQKIADLFSRNQVKDGDYFLFTDAWNPTVIQLRYMAELLGVKIKIGGLWHAGSYDPQDGLGQRIGAAKWVRNAEESMYYCYDHNFFATDFHIELFERSFPDIEKSLAYRVGWPMEYLEDSLCQYQGMKKRDLILFPHRISAEKQPEIFRDLKNSLPQYEFVMCQEQELTKNEYHNLLGEAKMVFSANLQETLGISWYEGVLVNTMPFVPDRLSYIEMSELEFKYPSYWTENFDSYLENKDMLIKRITTLMNNYYDYLPALLKQKRRLENQFFSGNMLYEVIRNGVN